MDNVLNITSPAVAPAGSASPAGSAAPAVVANPFVNADGSLAANWFSGPGMDASLKESKTLPNVKTFSDLALMFHNQEKVLGKKGQIVPTDPSDKATIDAYYKAVGWPDKPEEYPAPTMPAGMQVNPELDKTLRSWAHELHMTADQYKGLAERIAQANVAERNNAEADQARAAETARNQMRTAWGSKYEYNVQLANTAAAAFADENELAHAKEAGWLGDPVFLSIMQKVGSAVSPDRLHANSAGQTDTTALEQKIGELERSDAYRKSEHPQHDAVTQQVLNLRQQWVNARPKRAG